MRVVSYLELVFQSEKWRVFVGPKMKNQSHRSQNKKQSHKSQTFSISQKTNLAESWVKVTGGCATRASSLRDDNRF